MKRKELYEFIREEIINELTETTYAGKGAVEKITKDPLVIFEFREMKATGCTGHPLILEQEQMASQLTTFLRLILDKKV